MADIYGVTGMPLAGKSTVAEIIQDQGYSVLEMGDVVRQERDKRDIPTRKTGDFVGRQREKHGMAAIARLSAPYLDDLLDETEKIVITGMRSWEEKQEFQDRVGADIRVIAVWASRDTRKQRRDERQRKEDTEGDAFDERDRRELDQGVGDLMARSDHMIVNDGISLEQLRDQVRQILPR